MTVPYMTEERLRVLGFGGDFGALSSAEIKNMIMAASAKVDAWCNVPLLPQPYSFRGGTVVDEQQNWNPGDALTPAQRIIWARFTPIKDLTSLRIYVTTTQYTDFEPTELFLNRDLGAIEIISFALTSAAPFGAFVLPNIGMLKPQARLTYTYGYEFTETDEVLEPTDAWTYRAVNQFWDDSTVTVEVGGIAVSANDYTVDRIEGTITFDTPQAADAVVTASYGYTLPQAVSLATGILAYDLLGEHELHEKGMGGVRSLRVGEITIDRGLRWDGSTKTTVEITPEAEALLLPYRFVTAR